MAEPDVRAAVDAALRRHLEARRSGAVPGTVHATPAPLPSAERHPSHGLLPRGALPGDPAAGRCVMEPAVECVHCGYCQSQGY